ncbi:MAG: hypothetical protein F6J93_36125 [Oscillatoria sp. SIO1A7]|nr:hypothetical protein [Oscillatoria sp. SIO1A7]
MTIPLLERMGDWNPQLSRELKGRLKTRPVLMASGLSLVGQAILIFYFLVQLPILDQSYYNQYCVRNGAKRCVAINWEYWWGNLSHALYWILPIVLLMGGTYMLISDLAKEKHRGTLDFIRLSPQSSHSFLIGKFLGVPVLIYLAVALCLPLDLWSTIASQAGLEWTLGFYAIQAASCCFFYSAASLYTFMGGSQGWIGAGAIAIYMWVFQRILYLQPNLEWYWLPVGNNTAMQFGFLIFAYLLSTYWIWQALHRSFHNPSASMFSKKQSYGATACFEFVLFGFIVPQLTKAPSEHALYHSVQLLTVFNLLWFLGLIAAMSHHRQVLQDWARFSFPGKPGKQSYNQQDWIWGEKSPAPVAIAINLAIAAAIFVPWILLWPAPEIRKLQAIGGLIFSISLVSIYAVLAQLMLLMKTKKRALWAFGSICAAIGVPLVFCIMLSPQPYKIPILWLFYFPFAGITSASAAEVLLAGFAHLAILTGVSWRLIRELNRAGESATKAAIDAPRVS